MKAELKNNDTNFDTVSTYDRKGRKLEQRHMAKQLGLNAVLL